MVTLTVMFPAVVMLLQSELNRIAAKDAGFPTNEYLGVKVAADGPSVETMTPERRAPRWLQNSAVASKPCASA